MTVNRRREKDSGGDSQSPRRCEPKANKLFARVAFLAAFAVPLFASDAEKNGTFQKKIQPLLKELCITCHSTEKQKGELDLEQFKTISDIRKHGKVWQGVIEQLVLNEMPPKKSPQLSSEQKEQLLTWTKTTLEDIGNANAGDPGPVVLRRLSNAEYTYTLRDLTGVESLEPAKEFPVDGAAGEGFTNTGNSLVMSPTLFTKYLDAGKDLAQHAVLLPDGFRFSSKTSRRDHTEEIVAEIRAFYRAFTDPDTGVKANLQGVIFDTKDGGKLPLEKYFAATLAEREALAAGTKTIEVIAKERGLNAKYLATLHKMLTSGEPSLLLDALRERWKTAKPDGAKGLAEEVAQWQRTLWKFNSVGHIGIKKDTKTWLEPVSTLIAQQDIKHKLPPTNDGKDVILYLGVSDAGDGSANDVAVWKEPRLVSNGQTILLKDLRDVCNEHAARRDLILNNTAKALAAAAEANASKEKIDANTLAQKHSVDVHAVNAWLSFLGLNNPDAGKITTYFTDSYKGASGHAFINGWGKAETPNMAANSSDQTVRIPGLMKPHSIAVHPSPQLQTVIGWRSPVTAVLKVSTLVQRAHPECGNGVNWFVEHRRGPLRFRIASGPAHGRDEMRANLESISVQPGDVITLSIDPNTTNHSCDLTAVNMTLSSSGEKPLTWDLGQDVSPDVLAGNPHADRHGNKDVWGFFTEPVSAPGGTQIAPGSLLARWMFAPSADEQKKLADELQKFLLAAAPADKNSTDAKLHAQLTALGGALLGKSAAGAVKVAAPANPNEPQWGLDPALFGKLPNGQTREPNALVVQGPSLIEVRIPAQLAAGAEFQATAMLDKEAGAEGSVQFYAAPHKPNWPLGYSAGGPLVVNEGSQARARFAKAQDDVRQLFPAVLCYTKIVPADEVITLQLFYREDGHFSRLLLDDAQKAKLDRLWDELRFVSQDALTLVDAFEQLYQYATQDGDPKSLEPMREPLKNNAEALKKRMVDVQPTQVDAVVAFADRAFRRPLLDSEKIELRNLYKKLRDQELPHDDAIRLMLARVFVSPAFLYRAEKPGAGVAATTINQYELANRLSYFLWSSMPDTELRAAAAAGKLSDPAVLKAQTQRMLKDGRMRRMATEFACSWLHIHGFDELGEKSERHFPTFLALRGPMYEETIRFFADLFQSDGSVLGILDADHTFLNEELAKHYGIPGVTGADWRRVDGLKKHGRGGVLGQATTLAKQSGASRTSPILRGNWVAEALLGDKLPKPPKDVPPLPEDESNDKLTMRQLTEKHVSDVRCSGCHQRIDPYGFSLESFDAIGRFRVKDIGDRPIDTRTKVMDGTEISGLDGLRNYLLTTKRDAFLRQFTRKLVGYSLGRSVQLTDEMLMKEIQNELKANNFRVGLAVEKIVLSKQFQNIRGIDAAHDD